MKGQDLSFSVIMPAYNVAAYIEDAIKSVLAQTYSKFELIIIDDGSTDNTFEVINKFNDDRMVLIRQENKGLGGARNAGIACARNEYVAFLDSDDIWGKDKLANIVTHFNANAGLYYSQVMEFKESLTDAVPHKYTEPIREFEPKDLILIYDFMVISSVVIATKIMKEMGGFATDLLGTEDWDLLIRIGQKYSFQKVPEYDCFYRMNSNGLSKNRVAFLNKEFKVIDKHLIRGGLGSKEIKKLALWVWYKKNFYYHLYNMRVMKALPFFAKMLFVNPTSVYNWDFTVRAYKLIGNKVRKK